MRRRSWLFVPLIALGAALPADAIAYSPVLHERIPADPREDVALSVSLDGDLPAALETPSGIVTAPDPRRPPSAPPQTQNDPAAALAETPPNATFRPDRDTSRPDVLPYEDPFTPSTAPFKRLIAFDTVDANYTLSVRDPRMQQIPTHAQPAADGSDEQFYADLVIDVAPGRRMRIPTVGPGAKVVRARAGVGTSDVAFRMFKDGAENWFVEADVTTRARLVMELTIPRTAFGGELADPGWSDLPKVAPLPSNVARAANQVAAKIGVSRAMTPREDLRKLVEYFRSFVDSNDPPAGSGDIYLDLALSKKGVCRHRAFAFLVTAIGLGIPARMVTNEAHAWVEVHDGSAWRRIDLGGAGRALREPLAEGVHHDPPSDPFGWPPNATRGDELADRARPSSGGGGNSNGGNGGRNAGTGGKSAAASGSKGSSASGASSAQASAEGDSPEGANGSTNMSMEKDERPLSNVTVGLVDADAHRGAPLHVRGEVAADGEACAHVVVELALRDGANAREVALGSVATDAKGAYEGALVVPGNVPLGDYEIVAHTPGDARCGRSATPSGASSLVSPSSPTRGAQTDAGVRNSR